MITEFRLYEINNNEPELGDYVICNNNDRSDDLEEINYFIDNNIGQIINNKSIKYTGYPYIVKYSNIPTEFSIYTCYEYDTNDNIQFNRSEILYWSKNKEELESILNTNKFNI